MTPLATIAVSLSCFVLAWLGARTIIRQTQKIILGIRARSWPHAQGKVKHSCIVPNSSSQNWGERVEVQYAYEVDGSTYEGSTIHPCYSRMDPHPAVLWEKVRGAARVRISYDPKQPSRSTLSTGFHAASLFPIVPGLFALLPGMGLATWYLIKLAGWQANFEVMAFPS